MDWSLLQPHANKRFLRDVRGYKSTWYYYAAMILDPILRFNWIFYSIYTHDLQHSTLVSFFVAFSEVTRRGIWVIFRVENEHCSNVARFKASRDIPLPYAIRPDSEEDFEREDTAVPEGQAQGSPSLSRHRSRTSGALEAQETPGNELRRRPTTARTFTRVIADAHTQDFEKKRKPEGGSVRRVDGDEESGEQAGSSDEEDEDDHDEQDILDAQALLRERSRDVPGGEG
jgi:hypothetical protein